MKKLLAAGLMAIFCIMQTQAQDETKTLFKGSSELQSWGVALAPELSSTQFYNQNTAIGEIALGVILNNKWYIGGYYGASMNDLDAPQEMNPQVSELEFHSYGMRLEYTVAADNLLHLSFPLNIGIFDAENSLSQSKAYNEVSYLAVTPGAQLELNVSKYLRAFAGARYRLLVTEIDSDPVIRDVDSGVRINAGLRIGLFERSIN